MPDSLVLLKIAYVVWGSLFDFLIAVAFGALEQDQV